MVDWSSPGFSTLTACQWRVRSVGSTSTNRGLCNHMPKRSEHMSAEYHYQSSFCIDPDVYHELYLWL
jgi:hypothetical protein